MFKQKAFIGTIVSEETLVIEHGFLRRFYDAINSDLIWSQKEKDSVLTPDPKNGMPHSAIASIGDHKRVYKLLGLKPGQILISRASVTSFDPIVVGDTLLVHTVIKDLFEQQASSHPIGFVFINVIGQKNQKVVFNSERVLCVRGGFARR